MKRKAIKNDDRRSRVLGRVVETSGLATIYGSALAPPDLVARSSDLLSIFEEARKDVSIQYGQRRAKVATCNVVLEEVHREVVTFQRGLQLQTDLLGLGADYQELFRDPTDGRGTNKITESRGWLARAQKLVKGEQVAVERGFPPMTIPTVERLNNLIPKAQKACRKTDQANHNYMKALADIEEFRAEVDLLIQDVGSYLDYALRRFQPGRRRGIMRSYGFQFTGELAAQEEAAEDSVETLIASGGVVAA